MLVTLAFYLAVDVPIILRPVLGTPVRGRVVGRIRLLLIAGGGLVIALGCSHPRPLLAPQGPMRMQQNNASYHDPYPDNDAGPEIVGGRPRDFQVPSAEPVRSRRFAESLWGARP